LVHGVDFTSVPRKAKPITVASGRIRAGAFELEALEELDSFCAFEAWLARPGPWVAGFDFPFGLPRQALCDLGWPQTLPELTRHCAALGRPAFRAALDRHRAGRPAGAKFCYRRGDASAAAHSPLKLVNPPVALMFLEGASRLVNASVDIPGMLAGDPQRVALEAYPGFAVRKLFASRVPISYKNDAKAKQSSEQQRIRKRILRCLVAAETPFEIPLRASNALLRALRTDCRGDLLDAVLCALQAAWAWSRRDRGYGLPADIDPVEGWIVTVPGPVLHACPHACSPACPEQRSREPSQAFG
jgi:hypothetical protein